MGVRVDSIYSGGLVCNSDGERDETRHQRTGQDDHRTNDQSPGVGDTGIQMSDEFSKELCSSNNKQIKQIHEIVTRLDERVNGPNGALGQIKGMREDVSKLKTFRIQLVAWASGIATGASVVIHKIAALFKLL
jgi:hypothetical protein